MIKVRNEVTIHEVDGKEQTGLSRPLLVVESHWNRDELVVLYIGDRAITVSASDLRAAVENATNTKRFL